MAWTRFLWSAGALGLVLSLSGCSDRAELRGGLGRAAQAVINGTPDPNETGVVLVTHQDHPLICSGTLIGPTLVVTAKHCTFQQVANGPDVPFAGDRFKVGFGPTLNQLSYRGSTKMEWIGQPGNTEVQTAVDSGTDVALIWLSSAAPAGSVIHGVKTDYVPGSSDQFTIVGYGRNSLSNNNIGIKMMTVDDLVNVNGSTGIVQTHGKGACSGDSGGAFFFGAFPAGTQRELVGITSTAEQSPQGVDCAVGVSNASSVRNPQVSQFLLDALGIVGVCVPSAEVCGDGTDQDCDGIADNQCKKDGQACSSEVECASGLCEDTGAGKTCVHQCDGQTPCPAGSHCVTSCTQGFCFPGAQGAQKLGETCSDSSECASNHCGTAGCTVVCNPALGECPDDRACIATANCGECDPVAGAPGPRLLGELCSTSADCEPDAQCDDDGLGVLRCTTACLEGGGCPSGFVCHADRCVRGGGLPHGERCMGSEYCQSLACLTLPDPRNNFCAEACDPSIGCDDAFACQNVAGYDLCVPTGLRMGESCEGDVQCVSNSCNTMLGYCSRACNPKSAPCPPGFECDVVAGALACVDKTSWTPPTGGSGGTGAGGTGGSGASGGQPSGGGFMSKGAKNDPPKDSGCGCGVVGRPRSLSAWLLALGMVLALRARRRRSERER
jgi:MYXO-CTERM domain-containing protein